MSYRVDRVEHLVKEEISDILLHKIEDVDLGFLTVTNVRMSPDLRVASIYLSVFEKEKREIVLERIKDRTGFIRTELAHRIRIRFVPELRFFIDDTLDYVEKIEGLIKKIHEDDNKQNNKPGTP
ncbi:Ribosome-binding factor A [Ignavibacterium album JCM 16511]|uniref:Ribosome-binding factor A n=1 Tax=Ignavibacterium album (strain DSM 19864 / JCM 16511 / NBRC 101810 / Mat9-16) TaxID=945713 RepID=I0AH95_IGNAJ|nr:30S ribosome-binding factor RbfA [Ignavibacterium album]AFH48352.1 Ribosome-binding factor A [Ignavibacterium album JCM 16511]